MLTVTPTHLLLDSWILNLPTLTVYGSNYFFLLLLSFFASATALLISLTLFTSSTISLPVTSLCCLLTHMLKFSILETSMYTTLNGFIQPTPFWVERRHLLFLLPTNWNKSFNAQHVFQIITTMHPTLLTCFLPLIPQTTPMKGTLLLVLLITFLYLSVLPSLLPHLFPPLNVSFGTLRLPSGPTCETLSLIFHGGITASRHGTLMWQHLVLLRS